MDNSVLHIEFFFISGCFSKANDSPQIIRIHGLVLDGIMRRPLSEVSVKSDVGTTITGVNGMYELKFVGTPDTLVKISFEREGYISKQVKVVLKKEVKVNIRLELQTVKGKISGHAFINEAKFGDNRLQSVKAATERINYISFSILNKASNTYSVDEFIVFAKPFNLGKITDILRNINVQFRPINGIDAIVVKGLIKKELEQLLEPYATVFVPNASSVRLQGEPTDPGYLYQWHFSLAGFPEVWEKTQGDGSIIVAVLDSGVALDHPDLVHALIPGWDFVENDDLPQDVYGHGTMVAGIIAAAMDNGLGGVGAAPHVKIMPIRVFDQDGYTQNEWLLQGLNYAIDNGADVINMSFGAVDFHIPYFYQTIQKAYHQEIVLVGAAGNESGRVIYPAAYPEVIAVGAVDVFGERADYSSYGPELDIMAPGGTRAQGIYSTALINGQPAYGFASGTSFAAPHVAGLVALLKSLGFTNQTEIYQHMINSAREVGTPGQDWFAGYGLINAGAAVNYHTLAGIKVFLGEIDGRNINLRSYITETDALGVYELSQIQPGKWKLIGWLDNNSNKKIDTGDYWGLGPEIEYFPIKGNYYPAYNAVNIALKFFSGPDVLIKNVEREQRR